MAELVRKKTSALPLLAAGNITGKEFFSVGYQGSNYRVLLEELKTYIGVSGGGSGSVDLTSVLSDVVPFADNSYTLGAEGNHWKRVYVNDIDSDGDLTLSPGGNVLIPGSDLEVGGSIYMDGQLLSTRAYVDGMLSGKASADALSNLVGRVSSIEADYVDVDALLANLGNYYTKKEVGELIGGISLDGYLKSDEANDIFQTKITTTNKLNYSLLGGYLDLEDEYHNQIQSHRGGLILRTATSASYYDKHSSIKLGSESFQLETQSGASLVLSSSEFQLKLGSGGEIPAITLDSDGYLRIGTLVNGRNSLQIGTNGNVFIGTSLFANSSHHYVSYSLYVGDMGIYSFGPVYSEGVSVLTETDFTKENIKSKLGISDWALETTPPDTITESTVSGWGFTKNAGTITGIKMNGASIGTSGVVDLGTVLTSHQSLDGYINSVGEEGSGNVVTGYRKSGKGLVLQKGLSVFSKDEVEELIDGISIPSLDGYVTTDALTESLNNLANTYLSFRGGGTVSGATTFSGGLSVQNSLVLFGVEVAAGSSGLTFGGKIPMYSGDAYTKSEANKEFQQKGSYLTSSDLIGYLKPDGNGLVSHSGSFEIFGADGVIYLENGGIKGTLYGVDSWSIDDEGNGLFSSLKVGGSAVLTSSTVLQHLPLSEKYRSLILRSDGLSVRLGSKTSSAHLGKDVGFSTNGGLCISADPINGGLSIKLGTTADCYEGVGLRISSNPSDEDYGSLCVNYGSTLCIESGGSQLGVRLSSASGLGINYDGICVKCGTGLRISTYASNELYVPLGTGLAWVDNMLVSTVEGGSSISETVRSGGTINLSSATASSLNSLANSLPTNGIALYLVTDSRGDLPSLYGETFIQVSASGVPYLFGRSGSFGVSVGDLLAITKTSFGITQCRIIPLNDAKPATTAYGSVGADGLCTVWDKGQINRISTIADVAYAALPSSRQLPSLWADNMNEALSTGVYPWCTLGRPDGSLGAYTCVTHRSSTPDGSGYYTIEQTAYGRQDELGKVYKRIIFWKDSSTYEYGRWILIGE